MYKSKINTELAGGLEPLGARLFVGKVMDLLSDA